MEVGFCTRDYFLTPRVSKLKLGTDRRYLNLLVDHDVLHIRFKHYNLGTIAVLRTVPGVFR